MKLAIRFVLSSVFAITDSCSFHQDNRVLPSDADALSGAYDPRIDPSTSQFPPNVGADCALAHAHVETGLGLNTFSMHLKDPPVEHLGQPSMDQSGSQALVETPVLQNSVTSLLNLEATASQLKRKQDSSDYSSLLPSSNDSEKRRLSLNWNTEEIENETHAFRDSNDENNPIGNLIDLNQPPREEIQSSSDDERPRGSLNSIHNGIAHEAFDRFPRSLPFDPHGGTSRGVSETIPKLNDGLFPDALSLKPHASSQSMLSQSALSPHRQHGFNTRAVHCTPGASHSNLDHISKPDHNPLSEDHRDSSKLWRLEFNKHAVSLENPQHQHYSSYVSNCLRQRTRFQNGALAEGPDLLSFFSQLSRGLAASRGQIDKTGHTAQILSTKSTLFDASWNFFKTERETWLKFFDNKYHLAEKGYIATHDLAGGSWILPVYLFYAEMINEMIPMTQLNQAGILSAYISYHNFIIGNKQEDHNKFVKQIMCSKEKSNSKSLLWFLLEVWIKNYRESLFEWVKAHRKGKLVLDTGFKGFFNTMFSLYIQELKNKRKEILTIHE